MKVNANEIQNNLNRMVAGSLILQARNAEGLTQAALAEKLDVSQSTIAAYESGRRQPTLPTLLRFLRAAGFELDLDLVSLEGGSRLQRRNQH
jgi:transcriptional regulator with XRE-family HTH domain